jgi:hypothetical protein
MSSTRVRVLLLCAVIAARSVTERQREREGARERAAVGLTVQQDQQLDECSRHWLTA